MWPLLCSTGFFSTLLSFSWLKGGSCRLSLDHQFAPQVVSSAVLGEKCSEAGCLFLERMCEVCFMCVISGCILLEGRIVSRLHGDVSVYVSILAQQRSIIKQM